MLANKYVYKLLECINNAQVVQRGGRDPGHDQNKWNICKISNKRRKEIICSGTLSVEWRRKTGYWTGYIWPWKLNIAGALRHVRSFITLV